MKKWEYKTDVMDPALYLSSEDTLNLAGEDGWELVNIVRDDNGIIVAIYKRPKE